MVLDPPNIPRKIPAQALPLGHPKSRIPAHCGQPKADIKGKQNGKFMSLQCEAP